MYIYKSFVNNVVDGDTFDATVDLGFNLSIKLRFRLRGVDTPEIFHPSSIEEYNAGLKAKNLVSGLINNQTVTLRTYKEGAYNRWEADVILNDGRNLADIIKANNLNKLNS